MNKAAKTEGSGQILYEENLKEHCEVAALILRTLPSTSNTRDHVKAAIRKASNQVSSVRGGNNHIKAFYMSSAAEAQMLLGKFDNLIGEHLVPVKVLVTKILSLPPQTHFVIHKSEPGMRYAMNFIALEINELGCHRI